MAVKIPRGLGSASKQKGGSEKAKATDADGFDAASGISRDAKSKRTDAANDVRALHAVNVAIKANTAIFACKLGAYAVTGSSAMLAEAVHSVADVVNQGLLHVGINSSTRAPDAKYNYGYRRERFVWSLISAVGVFFMGSGVSVAHGVHSAWNPMELEHIWIGLGVLGASAAIDSYSLLVAYRALVDNAAAKEMTLREFVESGHDPTSVAVVAEDLAAVSGCAIAAGALFATQVTGNAIFDAAGSGAFVFTLVPIRPLAVGGLLGLTATYLINANRMLLLGRSLGSEKMDRIQREIRADPVVEEVYRAKSEELGPGTFRFVAEIEFSGTKARSRYLDQGDGAKREQLHGMFRAAAAREEPVDLDAALKMYGEEVVTAVGDEVDRIEKAIVRVEPSIHYVDLETN
ncbi:cation diffusion facilitator family [Micromonas pusilla CCMP1545]|uniref:Cation diffusion facilitator family n=1 Tax=Micromonas pusilla (strain CCMP1545) TaxID=564608 RepID=C1MSA4_MICPC|nr:cation diffusion facilitator family [Micromonas pusilla CCMP1545]EEH57471.1 cation diffusion facilitator family [Micromonas pusilla CCMP1545]|eukprot:XP_003059016.1 cation diffusion facilitator family [Micromonas pusilla CCMP1545]